MEAPALVANQLSKNYGRSTIKAVTQLTFEIQPGESVAFLGPNGAGKSTTIKMLCGILSPDEGIATVNGHLAGSQLANRRLGLIFGTRSQLYLHMTVAQCLDLVAEIYFVTGSEKRKRLQKLIDFFQVSELLPKRVRSLSLGQRMKCELIAALVHGPSILLADEPTIGLDVIAKNQLRELIQRWQKEERTTLMLTSHDLSDVEILCKRCILIDKGVKKFDGKIPDLKGSLSFVRRVQVTTHSSQKGPFCSHHKMRVLPETREYVHSYELSTKEVPISEALAYLSNHYGDTLQDICISEITLEEVLRKRYLDSCS